MSKRVSVFIWLCLLVVVGQVLAQDDNPDATISFPPPVYLLSGEIEIEGSASLAGQVNYFVEYQPLDDDLQPLEGVEDTWFPATLPVRTTIVDGILGTWDTTLAPDGIYALRLTVTTQTGAVFDIVSPVRIENEDPTLLASDLDTDDGINNALLALTATAEAFTGGAGVISTPPPLPTIAFNGGLAPTPTRLSSDDFTAEVLVIANLRGGDSTLHSIEAGLQPGTVLDVQGRSSRGSNWLFVTTPDGEEGWVAPSVVRLSGSILDLPEIEPPPPPVTPTPVPSPTPILPDANVLRVDVDRDLKEDEAFQILVTVRNDGGQFLPVTQIFCNVEPQDVEVTFSGGGLQPGSQGQFVIPLRVDGGGGNNINIICVFDPNNTIQESNRDNNTNSTTRFLEDDDD